MPNLSFSSNQVFRSSSGDKYHKFVNNVLSVRYNNNVDVSSVSLMLDVENPELPLKRILKCAFSRNVQQLTIGWIRRFLIPPSLLSSKSLKHLIMRDITIDCISYSPWDLPALTTLHLIHVRLNNCTSILAMSQNVKNLTLDDCTVFGRSDGFTIISSRLLSLTLKRVEWYVDFIHVETPQLKNLIIMDTPQWRQDEYYYYTVSISLLSRVTISAPDLTYLHIKGAYFPMLSLDEFRCLEKVDLSISSPQRTYVHKIGDLFQRIHSVKALSLGMEIVELLSTSEEVISHQPSPFLCLKSLKIYPLEGLKTLDLLSLRFSPLESSLQMFPTQLGQEQEAMKIKFSSEVAYYLLDSSSNATFTMVSYEEVRAIKITKVAHRLMADLWETLEEPETKRAYVESKKTLANSCREDFTLEVRPRQNTEMILYMLKSIKVLLTKVLASKRVEMQACFSRLYAKTKTLVSKMVIDDMKNQCDIKGGNYSGFLNEIALSY
ncbi:hypothetical protein Tco_0345329 [Tanacetum coccineum]